MELGKQIKKYRLEQNLSQEELADKIYVSRQTISNWENDKSYPDIKSLVLLSEVFHISLDKLIKGDLEKMKTEIDVREYSEFQRDSGIFSIMFIIMLLSPIPLVMLLKWLGLILYVCLCVVCMYYACKVEKYKKKYDIQTYKEIVAFTEGKTLDEIEKIREEAKRPYQKVLLAMGAAALAIVVTIILIGFIRLIL